MYFRFLLLLTTLLMSFLCSCHKEQPKDINNDVKQYNLKGNVKSITEINYSVAGKFITFILFNEEGFISEQASFNPDGTLIRKWVNTYDRGNFKLARHCYVGNDSLSYILRYYYNSQGKLACTKLFDPNEYLVSQYSTEYDDSMNVARETFLGEDATYKHLVIHVYDDQNKIKEDIFIDSVRNQTWKQAYQYNNLSQVKEIVLKSPDDSLIKTTRYTYLSNNKVDKATHYNSKEELVSTTDYTYDRMDNIVEIIEFSPDNNSRQNKTYQYSYDEQGNWTLLSESVNHQPGNVITRQIEYYN